MHVSTPPSAIPDRPPLRLARIERQRAAPGTKPFTAEDRLYFTDLMASYGMAAPDHLFERPHNSFRDLVAGLLPRLGEWGDRFDLAVLAHTTPDSEAGWPICYLLDAVPDAGLAFAISDQGPTASFTGLRLAARSSRTHEARRAQLWALDQTALLHEQPVPERIRPRHDSAVVLVLDEDGGLGRLEVEHHVEVSADEVRPRLRAVVGEDGGVVVCGPGLRPHWSAADARETGSHLHPVPAGEPCTGVWSALADLVGSEAVRYVVADYDEELRHLGVCVLDNAEVGR